MNILDRLFNWFQRRCKHDPRYVMADIMQGDASYEMQWCYRCGAHRGHQKPEDGSGVWLWQSPNAEHAANFGKTKPF